ncbi:hypothetical protein C0J52_17426 [Blattella germanica]|nr:hypothetical protein C0J52_17426 [Blattella germanica]
MFKNPWTEQKQPQPDDDGEPESKKLKVSVPEILRHPLDMFFCSMCESTKQLPTDLQLRVKKKLFEAVTQAEEEFNARKPLTTRKIEY